MSVLVIDDRALADIKRVREYALANRCTIHDIMDSFRNAGLPGNNPNRFVKLVDGWKVVYTIDQHPGGWFHHISLSVPTPPGGEPRYPPMHPTWEILKLFELPMPEEAYYAYEENTPNHGKAVNLLYRFSEPPVALSGTVP